jgi:ABC-type glycerol-3-phosphate transport system substrate-binding protein
MVQLISVVDTDDEKKRQACADFAAYLLSEQVQKKLEALGVYPVLPGLEIYQDNDFSASVYNLLSGKAALALPEDRPLLNDLATQALGGNKDALEQLRHILGG